MRASSIVAASVALVAGANAHSYDNVTYTTEIVTAYTTVCPTPTEIVYGTQTYTVTEVSIYATRRIVSYQILKTHCERLSVGEKLLSIMSIITKANS